MIALILALLLSRPAGAEDAAAPPPETYDLTFTFTRGAKTQRFSQSVQIGQNYNAVWSSTVPALRQFIVNATPVLDSEEGDIELMYQVEWDEDGTVLLVQDSANFHLREEAVLSALAGDWTISARLTPHKDRDSCTPPSSGGGVLARVRGPGVDLTRRTRLFQQSNLTYHGGPKGELSVSLLPRMKKAGGYDADYVVALNKALVDGPAPEVNLDLGVETPLPGTDFTLTLTSLPNSPSKKFSVPEVPEGKLLRHAGRPVSFLHPKGWEVFSYCDDSYALKNWRLQDDSLPLNQRFYDVAWIYVVKDGTKTYRERAPKDAVDLPNDDGRCVFWSRPGRDEAACDLKGGLRLDFGLQAPTASRTAHFKRLVSSLRAD